MPQPVSIFPQSGPKTSPTGLMPADKAGSSKFDTALESARGDSSKNKSSEKGDSSEKPQPNHAAPTKKSDASSKPAGAKSKNTAGAKSGVKTADKTASQPESEPESNPDAQAHVESAVDAKEAPQEEHSDVAKPRVDVHPKQLPADLNTTPPPGATQLQSGLKAEKEQPKTADDESQRQPKNKQASVEAIPDGNLEQGDTAGVDSRNAASVPAQQGISAANGHGFGVLAKGSQGVAPANTPGADAQQQGASDVPVDAGSAAAQAPPGDDTASPVVAGADNKDVKAGATAQEADRSFSDVLSSLQGSAPTNDKTAAPAVANAHHVQTPAREVQFADANHPQMVTEIHSKLLPNGGSMQIQLHPAELGAMSVSVQMRDGVMTATFDTTNDQAAKLLTHSLGQLKTALESQGMSVGHLHVQQSPRDSQADFRQDKGNGGSAQEKSSQQQEQQRKEMLKRMWRRLNGGKDPLDLVA